jgi:hypothetical protein
MLSGQRYAIEDTGGPLKSGRLYLGWPWTTEYLSGLHQMIRWPWNRPGYQIRPDRRNLDPGRLDSTSPASSSGYYFAKRCLRRRISKIGKHSASLPNSRFPASPLFWQHFLSTGLRTDNVL